MGGLDFEGWLRPDDHGFGEDSGTVSTTTAVLPSSSIWSAVVVANRCIRRAIAPVHPVWWLAPSPAPLSPWKYS